MRHNHSGNSLFSKSSQVFEIETTGRFLEWGTSELAFLGSAEARVTSERILEEILGIKRSELYLESGRRLSARHVAKAKKIVQRRKKREPLAYLLGNTYFWNEALEVGHGCLIPRPETEILVERFIENSGFKKDDGFHFLDLGAGSGAIGIALLRHFPKSRAAFVDVSKAALKITRKNLSRYGLSKRATLTHSDLFRVFKRKKRRAKFDAILSNPPYLARADWKKVEPEILAEPKRALDGGPDGLDFYRRIIREVPEFLKPEGWLVLEVGINQSTNVMKLFSSLSSPVKPGDDISPIHLFKDHNDIDRVIMARINS